MFTAPAWSQTDLFELFDLGLLESVGLDRWLETTVQRCTEWFEASGVSVFLADDLGEFVVRGRAGKQVSIPDGTTIGLGSGLAGKVLEDGKARIVGDPAKEPMFANAKSKARKDIGSSMIVPLVNLEGDIVGILNLSRTSNEEPFLPKHLKQAKTVASHVASAVSNARLVTSLQRANGSLWIKNEQLKAVLDSAPVCIMVVDADGKTSAQGAVGSPESPLAVALIERTIRKLVNGEPSYAQRIHDPQLDRTWIVESRPVSTGGGVIVAQDVSQVERSQREATRLRRLAEAGQMTAALAHEIRNPLTGIKGAAQMIMDDPSCASEFAPVVYEEAKKLDTLCDGFLAFSRPVSLLRKSLVLAELAQTVADLLTPEFKRCNVSLSLSRVGDGGTTLLDGHKVELVFHNLLRNAIQSSASEVVISVGDSWAEIRDNGTGMDDRAKSLLFSPFFTTKADGTGLGLCNVQKIVEAHGGSIKVDSEPGVGTIVNVCFQGSR